MLELRQLKRKTIRPSKRFITDDTIAVAITALAAHTMVKDTGRTTVTATAIGPMVIMAMAGDQASALASGLAGAGATKSGLSAETPAVSAFPFSQRLPTTMAYRDVAPENGLLADSGRPN